MLRGEELKCEVRVEADPETVFPFFTDPGKLTRWMGTQAELDPRPGGIYRVQVLEQWTARGEYVEVDPPRRVVFTWGWENEGSAVAPGASTVEVSLVADGAGTLVTLRHRDLPSKDSRDQHQIGWEHYMRRLATAAAGGDPGPDNGPSGEAS
jgi:uncharacterized protein YndB with AHSA1/START domain